jgi:hypothetical protein
MVLDGLALAKVLELEHLPDLDLAVHERHPARPFDCFFLRLRLDQPEAGDELLRFRERAVDDRGLAARELDPGALRAALEAVAASMTPLLIISSLKRPMSASSFSVGITPASDLSVALTMSMKRMM